jgi:hypothetical protein
MRFEKLTPFLVLFACGDNLQPGTNPQPDGALPVDATSGTDADVASDALPADGAVDPPGAVSRVWVFGDFLTDNTRQAGAFLDGDTMPPAFPYTTASPPPVVVPSSGMLSSRNTGPSYLNNNFDARAGKVVFVANLTTSTRYDLYVANADGSSPMLLVEGNLVSNISAPVLSPDGSKVAFLRDSLLSNEDDLWVVSTTGTGAPVRVSPDRALLGGLGQNVYPSYTWSPDSRYLAFSGDFTLSNYDQAYVVDTFAATPTPVELLLRDDITATSGTRGVRGTLRFDANNNVYFRARVSDASLRFTLFKASVSGSASRAPFALPPRADNSTPDVGNFTFTPDGTKIIFSADSPTAGQYNLFIQDVGGTTATNLTNVTEPGNIDHNITMVISPSGTHLAAIGAFGTTVGDVPYVVALDGSGMRAIGGFSSTCTVNCDYTRVDWSADGKYVYAVGDALTNNDTQLYRLDPAQTEQVPTPAVDVPSGGDVFGVLVVPAS